VDAKRGVAAQFVQGRAHHPRSGNPAVYGHRVSRRDTAMAKTTMRFVAPAAEVRLEISLRSAGACDLDDFALTTGR